MQLEPLNSIELLKDLKQRYLSQTTAPLDGMWLHGFVPAARHYAWCEHDELRGYLCVNDEGYLLQFFVDPRYRDHETALFESAVVRGESSAGPIKGAFVSTAEPHPLSLCLDHYRAFEVNALMYQLDESMGASPQADRETIALERLVPGQLPLAVAFAMAEIGAPEQWVTGYYANLIERGELYGSWRGEQLVATGESRCRDEPQGPYADLGVIVARSCRGQGLATRVLATLVSANEREGVTSVCSTERGNRAAQKAIARVGFVAHNRILRFDA